MRTTNFASKDSRREKNSRKIPSFKPFPTLFLNSTSKSLFFLYLSFASSSFYINIERMHPSYHFHSALHHMRVFVHVIEFSSNQPPNIRRMANGTNQVFQFVCSLLKVQKDLHGLNSKAVIIIHASKKKAKEIYFNRNDIAKMSYKKPNMC